MCPAATFLGSEKATMAKIGGGCRRCRVAGPRECSAILAKRIRDAPPVGCSSHLHNDDDDDDDDDDFVEDPTMGVQKVRQEPILNTMVLFKKIDRLKLARFSEALGADFALGPHKTWVHVNLKLLLSEYFTSVGEKFKSIICENLKCKRMPRKWSDTKNKVDCGVYLMRHMESYVGESVAKWDCGLTSGDRLQLQMLSLCYMNEFYIVDINAHRTSNVAHALRFLSGQ